VRPPTKGDGHPGRRRQLVERYALGMNVKQRLAEPIHLPYTDASGGAVSTQGSVSTTPSLCSSVQSAPLAPPPHRAAPTPPSTLQRRFLTAHPTG